MARDPKELEDLRFKREQHDVVPRQVTITLTKEPIIDHGFSKTMDEPYQLFVFPPRSLEEAEAQSLDLLTQILEIEAQLGDKTRQTAGSEYWEWRRKANSARAIKTAQRARLRAWIKTKTKYSKPIPQNSGQVGICTKAAQLLRDLIADGVELSDGEMLIIDELEAYAKPRQLDSSPLS